MTYDEIKRERDAMRELGTDTSEYRDLLRGAAQLDGE